MKVQDHRFTGMCLIARWDVQEVGTLHPPERTVSLTLLPGGVGAGFPHPALLIGVVIMAVSGEDVLDGSREEEGDELQLAVSSAQSATEIYHTFVPTLDMLCIT
jgi:hypothetical protein